MLASLGPYFKYHEDYFIELLEIKVQLPQSKLGGGGRHKNLFGFVGGFL